MLRARESVIDIDIELRVVCRIRTLFSSGTNSAPSRNQIQTGHDESRTAKGPPTLYQFKVFPVFFARFFEIKTQTHPIPSSQPRRTTTRRRRADDARDAPERTDDDDDAPERIAVSGWSGSRGGDGG